MCVKKHARANSNGRRWCLFRSQHEPTAGGRRDNCASQHILHEGLLQRSPVLAVQRGELPRTLCLAMLQCRGNNRARRKAATATHPTRDHGPSPMTTNGRVGIRGGALICMADGDCGQPRASWWWATTWRTISCGGWPRRPQWAKGADTWPAKAGGKRGARLAGPGSWRVRITVCTWFTVICITEMPPKSS